MSAAGSIAKPAEAAGFFTLGDRRVARVGYGAMQLTGPNLTGMPLDPEDAIPVLRRAVELGVTHIDTSDFYGPHTVNQLIRKALHPYPESLCLATKVGALHTASGDLRPATNPQQLRQAVYDNLRHLGVDTLDVVNLRLLTERNPLQPPAAQYPLEEQFSVLAALREQGLIKHLGLSNVAVDHLQRARRIAPVVCVQNLYNIAHRDSEALIAECEAYGAAFVPFPPASNFTARAQAVLSETAAELGATSVQVALAWLLVHSSNILLIPGTSRTAHLEQNIAAASIALPQHIIARLDAIAPSRQR